MKRIISILISVLLILSSVLFVSAADSVSFALGSVDAENNRLVSVGVYADSDSPFSAAVFDFSFDKTILEFRGVDSDVNTTTKYNPTNDGVRVVYLCTDEIAPSNRNIFKLDFKTLKEGRADVSFSVRDCADSGGEFLEVGSCSGAQINVSGSGAGASGGTGSSAPADKSGGASSKASSLKNQKAEAGLSDSIDDTDDDDLKNSGELNDINESSLNLMWILYVLIGLGVAIILVAGVKIGMSIAAKRPKKGEKPDNDE